MRLIDADRLKRRAQKIATEAWKMRLTAPIESVLNQFIDWIDEQPTVEPKQRWIPCSERLPEKDGSYWVCGRWGSGKIAVGDCEYSTEDGYFQTAWNFDVWAWMPLPELPEPYQEGE